MRFFTGINHQLVQDFSATRCPQILSDTLSTLRSHFLMEIPSWLTPKKPRLWPNSLAVGPAHWKTRPKIPWFRGTTFMCWTFQLWTSQTVAKQWAANLPVVLILVWCSFEIKPWNRVGTGFTSNSRGSFTDVNQSYHHMPVGTIPTERHLQVVL